MKNSFLFRVNEASAIGEARRSLVMLAQEIGLSAVDAERGALIVTEAATNLVKHAGGGQILFRQFDHQGLEILALDTGAGIRNLGEALRDGYTTTNSPGSGLGAIARLSDVFQIHSQPENGTALFSRIQSKSQNIIPTDFEIGVVCLPHPKETVCGDGWAVKSIGGRHQILIADGLGHGTEAAFSADEAIRLFTDQTVFCSPVEMLEMLHKGLKHTRGAAISVVEIESGKLLRCAGIGNIAGAVYTPGKHKHLVSHNGIAGHEARKIGGFNYAWEHRAMLVLQSDGLQTRWNIDSYAGLSEKHPSLIAGVLYRDFVRGNDDATVLVFREK